MSHSEYRIRHKRLSARVVSSIAALVLLGLGCDLPRDPEGTLDRVRGGTIRVGVSPDSPWTEWTGEGENRRPSGIEVELVERFADELGAEIAWVRGTESELLVALENYDLDLVIAGLTDDTPWASRIGRSTDYVKTADGKHVFATPPGENAFVLRLDRFLAAQEDQVRRRLAEQGPVAGEAQTP